MAPAAMLLATACGDRAEEAPTPDPFISTDNPRDELTEADYGDLDPSQVGLNTPWGRNIVSKDAPERDPATLTNVSTQSSDGYDRAIFAFDSHIPGFRLALGTEAGGGCDGTGEAIEAPAHLAVELTGARANRDGSATVTDPTRALDFPAMTAAMQTCDEGDSVRWILGTTGEIEYRIMETLGEPRLVVDLRHP
ncbi:MAG: hypothetical protein OXU75_22540 [Deltaproteobacteria bacterium]|nr:hypothetical protein [Deltaproteobacteria bacterium]MDE0035895.1 hypothetical protein [Deltaproteobacteria bacterium]